MTEWGYILSSLLDCEGRRTADQREIEHVNALANRIQKYTHKEMRVRKGKLIKIIRQWHHPNIGHHYDFALIRWAIGLLWLAERT